MTDSPDGSFDADTLRLAYQLSMHRLVEADSKLWQVPGLSLTAQAFLLTIALGSRSYSANERLVAAALGLVVALASVQLMRRHRYHASCDVAFLQHVEVAGAMPRLVDRAALPGAPTPRGLARLTSAAVWEGAMWLFALANVVVGVRAL
ncbi:hypothetical protein LL946_12555 [Knoellia locipacati]|uniref:hypothetical protein n=1 Tax=Knoellia locipacati TaxID=882824 RepID=UPI00384F638D